MPDASPVCAGEAARRELEPQISTPAIAAIALSAFRANSVRTEMVRLSPREIDKLERVCAGFFDVDARYPVTGLLHVIAFHLSNAGSPARSLYKFTFAARGAGN